MEEDGLLLDQLMANAFVLNAFMLQISLELAKQQSDPQQWAAAFISELHSRVDANEARVGADGRPIHEIARQLFDTLGFQLRQILAAHRP